MRRLVTRILDAPCVRITDRVPYRHDARRSSVQRAPDAELAGPCAGRVGGRRILKVCLVHNFYQEPGGEDQVFAAEVALLEEHGHEVLRYTADNDDVPGLGKLALAGKTIWSQQTYRHLRRMFRVERPDVVHFHNTLPLVSPAAYYAARRAGAAVVQTLHNYRLICPSSTLFRDGRPCEDCVLKRVRWPGVVHRCYRSSVLASGTVASMLAVHGALGTWHRTVNAYIALTEFGRRKFIAGGLPEHKIMVKPNFLASDPGVGNGNGNFALFVGRLAPEKGVDALLRAWTAEDPGIPLKIAGAGVLSGRVETAARTSGRIEWLGHRTNASVRELMKQATVLVFPSEWYEGLPITIVEAYATGLPIVASDLGAMSTLVAPGRTGMLFPPGDAREMAGAVRRVIHDPARLASMRIAARAEFDTNFTAARNYGLLTQIYSSALANAAQAHAS